jgi:hypothetical protein
MNFHAVLPGGDEPRWLPLIVHLAATKWQNANCRVSWQMTVVTADYSCDEQ